MRIDWSEPALDDLRDIDNWLSREASSGHAVRTLSSIKMRCKFLEDFPRGGRPHRGTHRILRVFGTPYLIRYQISGDVVEVIRVHHERENWFVEP